MKVVFFRRTGNVTLNKQGKIITEIIKILKMVT